MANPAAAAHVHCTCALHVHCACAASALRMRRPCTLHHALHATFTPPCMHIRGELPACSRCSSVLHLACSDAMVRLLLSLAAPLAARGLLVSTSSPKRSTCMLLNAIQNRQEDALCQCSHLMPLESRRECALGQARKEVALTTLSPLLLPSCSACTLCCPVRVITRPRPRPRRARCPVVFSHSYGGRPAAATVRG